MAGENVLVVREQGGAVLRAKTGATLVIEEGVTLTGLAHGVGAANGANVTVVESLLIPRKTRINIANQVVAITDVNGTCAYGSHKLYDFPEGQLQILGIVGSVTLTAGAGGIIDAANIPTAMGTVAADGANATITSTEADIIASNTVALSGGVGTYSTQHASLPMFNGNTTPKDLILNFAMADDQCTADDTLTVNGFFEVTWFIVGDR